MGEFPNKTPPHNRSGVFIFNLRPIMTIVKRQLAHSTTPCVVSYSS